MTLLMTEEDNPTDQVDIMMADEEDMERMVEGRGAEAETEVIHMIDRIRTTPTKEVAVCIRTIVIQRII